MNWNITFENTYKLLDINNDESLNSSYLISHSKLVNVHITDNYTKIIQMDWMWQFRWNEVILFFKKILRYNICPVSDGLILQFLSNSGHHSSRSLLIWILLMTSLIAYANKQDFCLYYCNNPAIAWDRIVKWTLKYCNSPVFWAVSYDKIVKSKSNT